MQRSVPNIPFRYLFIIGVLKFLLDFLLTKHTIHAKKSVPGLHIVCSYCMWSISLWLTMLCNTSHCDLSVMDSVNGMMLFQMTSEHKQSSLEKIPKTSQNVIMWLQDAAIRHKCKVIAKYLKCNHMTMGSMTVITLGWVISNFFQGCHNLNVIKWFIINGGLSV